MMKKLKKRKDALTGELFQPKSVNQKFKNRKNSQDFHRLRYKESRSNYDNLKEELKNERELLKDTTNRIVFFRDQLISRDKEIAYLKSQISNYEQNPTGKSQIDSLQKSNNAQAEIIRAYKQKVQFLKDQKPKDELEIKSLQNTIKQMMEYGGENSGKSIKELRSKLRETIKNKEILQSQFDRIFKKFTEKTKSYDSVAVELIEKEKQYLSLNDKYDVLEKAHEKLLQEYDSVSNRHEILKESFNTKHEILEEISEDNQDLENKLFKAKKKIKSLMPNFNNFAHRVYLELDNQSSELKYQDYISDLAIKETSADFQMNKLSEELGELISAIGRIRNDNKADKEAVKLNFIEELAHVQVQLNIVSKSIDREDFKEQMQIKLDQIRNKFDNATHTAVEHEKAVEVLSNFSEFVKQNENDPFHKPVIDSWEKIKDWLFNYVIPKR